MDGQFVPNITISIPLARWLENLNPHMMDLHLIIENPERFLRSFFEAAEPLVKVATVEDFIKSVLSGMQ